MAKEVRTFGILTEDLKKMDMNEVLKLLPARVRRHYKRTQGLAKHAELRKKINDFVAGKRKKPVKTHCRDYIVTPNMIGMTLKVYNGKEFKDVLVIEPMIGHYLGEFAFTRQTGAHSGPGIGATKSSKAAKK